MNAKCCRKDCFGLSRFVFSSMYGFLVVVGCMFSCCGGGDFHSANAVVTDTVMERLLFTSGKDVLTGGDGAVSIVVDKERSVWLWGDSYVGEATGEIRESTIPSVFGNVFVVLEGDVARTIRGGTSEHPRSVIESEPVGGRRAVYWPHHGLYRDSVLHLFVSRIVFGGGDGGMWDFSCVAVVYFRLSYPGFRVMDGVELSSYPLNEVAYGYGLHEYRGHYYFYGSRSENHSSTLHAGRARMVDNRLTDFEYFDGAGWTVDPSKTAPLKGIDVPISSQFSVFGHGDKYILLNQEKGVGANDIYTFVADTPVGPWYNGKRVYSTPEPTLDENLFAYNAMAHPQYDRDGMLLTSYCINTHRPTHRVSDYRPRFIRIPYVLILQ